MTWKQHDGNQYLVAAMSIQQTASPPTPRLHEGTEQRKPATTGANRRRRGVHPLGERSWTSLQRYLDDHLGDVVRLEEMARVACTSRFHFARRFRARVGTSPIDYVMTRRIELAKKKLASGENSICTVAHDLGFFDQSHFSRTFCRRVGVTPGEYRAQASVHHPKE